MTIEQTQADESDRTDVIEEVVSVDPVSFEVVRNGLQSYCNEGWKLVKRNSYAPTITEGNDHTVAFHDADGRLITHSEHSQAPHLGGFEDTVTAVLEEANSIEPGDVFIHNDPYIAGSHHNDVNILKPIFVDGDLFAFAGALCHWPDVGGPVAGTFNPIAREAYEEGLIIPTMKIATDDTEVNGEAWRLISKNIRMPGKRQAELHSQMNAVNLIDQRVHSLIDDVGQNTVEAVMEEYLDYQQRLFEREIEKLPDGSYEFVDFGDMDVNHEDQPPIRVHAELTIDGSHATFDFTGSDDAPNSSWGFTRTALRGAVYDGTMHTFPNVMPFNHGVGRALTIESRKGSCIDVEFPTPITGYCSGAFEKVDAVAMGCWGQAMVEVDASRVHAGTVNLANVCTSGVHPERGDRFVSYLWQEGGQGARTFADGEDYMQMIYIGGAANQSMEVLERHYPMIHNRCETVVDSCGDGKYRGGMGLYREFRVWGDTEITCHGDRAKFTPYGLGGGTNGGPNILEVKRAGSDEAEDLGMFTTKGRLNAGDTIIFGSNGGGGYGDPYVRDPEKVLDDVVDGYITEEKAREVYGVEITVNDADALDYEVDEEATAELRADGADRDRVEGYGAWEVHPHGKKIVAPQDR